jgi:hypothetical protein
MSAIGLQIDDPLPVRIDRDRAGVFNPFSGTWYPGAAAVFTPDGLIAVIDGRPALVLLSVPSASEVQHVALPFSDVVTALATEPNGDRVAINMRARVLIFNRTLETVRVLYDPPGCTVVQNGLSWVMRPE